MYQFLLINFLLISIILIILILIQKGDYSNIFGLYNYELPNKIFGNKKSKKLVYTIYIVALLFFILILILSNMSNNHNKVYNDKWSNLKEEKNLLNK